MSGRAGRILLPHVLCVGARMRLGGGGGGRRSSSSSRIEILVERINRGLVVVATRAWSSSRVGISGR